MEAAKEIALLCFTLLMAVLIAANREVSALIPIILVLGAYLIWHFQQLLRLYFWSRYPKKYRPPIPIGLWHAIVFRLSSWRRRNAKRKRKLKQLATQVEQSYRATTDITIIIDKHDQIEWLNDAAMTFAQARSEAVTGTPFKQVFSNQDNLLDYFNLGIFQKPLRMNAPNDPETVLELRIFPYSDGKKLLNAQNISLMYQLETVRKDFVANVSHEMRTPLTVLSGYLETMNDDNSFRESDWGPIIETMHMQTYRLQRIVDDLLVLSRLENVHGEDEDEFDELIDIPKILGPILIEAHHLSGKAKHAIEVEYHGETSFYGRAAEMDTVMSNLVFNAIKYTPDRGKITINWVQDHTGAYFEVLDNGPGIPKQHIARLTERFYRVDKGRSRDSGGTGLGLAIVKHALNRLGGELEIESVVGKGSLFRCRFPNLSDISQPDEPDDTR